MSVSRSKQSQSVRDDLGHGGPNLRRVQGRQRRHGRLRQTNDECAARISLRDKGTNSAKKYVDSKAKRARE
jgi:hypothetical protein